MKCDGCKYADWKKTSNGRLHPDKTGRCRFEWVPPPFPAAFYFSSWSSNAGEAPRPSGGFIERGQELRRECPCREELPPAQDK